MRAMHYSDTRANLKTVMDRVVDDHEPVIVTRRNGEPVVIVSLSDWNSMDETAYLLSTPANAAALREAVAGLNAGLGVERELINP
ncbi:type II toxin-antitoxin system Phd/YefM family antitoxin [Sandaracinobacteroides saxicola]|uniref:Antitoxin n=1 Tax=Sandaracinobacteroides saxicola TaxID=2759707 RepID=A0A7G5IGR2_9SPHN|nr:type II toxin-antitoxin system prevent-host-death family antitoxin [Sandaracinobacteroides saxicola]QMW22554.1 type II toxin-antitoxin system prevent-host-death family antitoxin [Sandaracinobacteroides saxicola]